MDDATIPISNISAVPETRCQCGGTFVFDDARGMMVCRSCRQIKCLVTEKALAPGDLIDDRYRLLKLIGKGGMGSLYLCAPKDDMSSRFAIKALNLSGMSEKSLDATRKRMVREAQMLYSLEHKNIVKVYEAWEDAKRIYIVMEFVNGSNLEEIKKGGVWDFEEGTALQIMWQIADALEYAWDTYQILHRDIKPSNIMLDEQGHIKLLDFGIAKSMAASNGETALTIQGEGIGTPGYMSPEQFTNSGVMSCTTDIYSLAATVYYLLTGHPPFPGKNVVEIYEKMLDGEAAMLYKVNSGISKNFSKLIRAMLQREPENRPQTWSELKENLELVQNGHAPKFK